MLTAFRVEARFGELKPFHGLSRDDVRLDDFIHIGFADVPIPDCVRIDHDVWSVLALIEAARLIGANPAFQAALGKFLFEHLLQLGLGERIAASTWMAGWPLVTTDEDVSLKFRHQATVITPVVSAADSSASQIPSKSTKYPCTSTSGMAAFRFAAARFSSCS